MKKRTVIMIMVLLLTAAGLWLFAFTNKEKPVSLQTEKPHYGYISLSVTATGTIQPVDTVAVGTQVSGTIKKVFVDFNSVVKKGALLAQLDQSLLLAQAQQMSANLQQSQSNLIYQQANFNRQSELYTAGAISKADFETAQNLYRSAKDNVNSLEAQVRAAQKNLSYTNIYSPIDGTVLSRNISEGQTVASSFSTPTLFTIAKDLTKMQVRASVDEADIGNVKQGERVTFTVDAFPEDVFTGTVQEIRLEPSVASNVVTYTTIINAANDQLKLKPGMTANISIYTKEEKNAMLISVRDIQFTPDATLARKIIKATPGNDENIHTGTVTGNNKMDSSIYKKAVVWLKIGDSIMQKNILTGLNDDVHIQVISGLPGTGEIVMGINKEQEQKKSSGTPARSPFIPARPGQNNNVNAKKPTS